MSGKRMFQTCYMAIGRTPEGGVQDGPWWCEDPEYLQHKLLPWLSERVAGGEVFVAEVLMPPDAYTRLGSSSKLPR